MHIYTLNLHARVQLAPASASRIFPVHIFQTRHRESLLSGGSEPAFSLIMVQAHALVSCRVHIFQYLLEQTAAGMHSHIVFRPFSSLDVLFMPTVNDAK